MAFNYNTRMPSQQGQLSQQISTSLGNQTKNIWIIGNRLLPSGDTYLAPLNPNSSGTLYQYYKCYLLNPIYASDSQGLLTYFADSGFNVQSGYSADANLIDASTVVYDSTSQQYTVTFNNLNTTTSTLIQSLTSGDNITATWTDGINSGNYISCEVINNNAVFIFQGNTSGQILVGDNITLSFTDTSIQYPDIKYTDPIVVLLFYVALFNSLNTNLPYSNFATPNVYFTVMPDTAHSNYSSPISSAFTNISAPTSVTGSDNTIVLQIPLTNDTSTNPVGYIPNSILGNSALTQAQNTNYTNSGINIDATDTTSLSAIVLYFTSANSAASTLLALTEEDSVSGSLTDTTTSESGTFVSIETGNFTYQSASYIYKITLSSSSGDWNANDSLTLNLIGITTVSGIVQSSYSSGTSLIVTLNSVDTFNTSDNLTLTLDTTATIFSYLISTFASTKISLSYFNLPFYMTSSEDFITYITYFTFLSLINSATYKTQGQGVAKIVFEADPSIITNLLTASTILQAITGTTGNGYYFALYNNYTPIAGLSTSIPIIASTTSSVASAALGSNIYTSGNTNSLCSMINMILYGLPTNATTGLTSEVDGYADQIAQVGWNAVCVNTNGQAYLPFPISNQLQINDVNDTSLFPEYIWQIWDYYQTGVLFPINSSAIGLKQTSSEDVILKGDIASFNIQLEDDDVLINVANNNQYLSISQSTNNTFGLVEQIVLQPISVIESIYYTLYVYGSQVELIANPITA